MKIKKFKDWKESTKVLLFRVWLAGAIAFFIGWTPIGGAESSSPYFIYQLIIALAIGLFITNIILMGPVKRMMFNLPDRKRYKEPVLKRILENLLHVVAMILLVILVWLTYAGINSVLELFNIYGENGLPFLLFEPFTFGIFYGIYFSIGQKILNKMLGVKPPVRVDNKENTEEENES